ncbi:MAG: hypothetical protein JST84_24210 [Acidobacteria bacterium]|nr:hypothetical protein [Acidobacteriota bacterium]
MKLNISSSYKRGRSFLLIAGLAIGMNSTIIPQSSQRLTGDLWIAGAVTLNNTPATSGVAVFNNSQIKTARNSSATVNLGKLGRIKLEPEVEMSLQFSNGLIGGTQKSGLMAVSANQGVRTKVSTPHVLVESDGAQLGLFSIEVKSECTCVMVNRGKATLTVGQKITQLAQGQALSFDLNGPEKVGHCEGLKASGLGKPLAIAGAVTAATLIPLTRDSISAVRGTAITSATTSQATNQSVIPPTTNATNNPTTPVKPPPAFQVCGCSFDKDGKALAPAQASTICHVGGNGNKETQAVACAALTAHLNLNGTPRAGHSQDSCGACQ